MDERYKVISVKHYRYKKYDDGRIGKKLYPFYRRMIPRNKIARDFIPAERGGRTTVTLMRVSDGQRFTAEARCNKTDNFCFKVGKDLALKRALEGACIEMKEVSQ